MMCCAFAVLLMFAPRLEAATWTLKSSQQLPSDTPEITFAKQTFVSASGSRELVIHLVSFDRKKCGLVVLDRPQPHGDLAAVMREHGCLAGVNGGYFHADRTPVGLVISRSKTIHPLQRAKLISGVVAAFGTGQMALLRVGEYLQRPRGAQEALQAGPFLVDRGKLVAGLDARRSARRTVVLADANGVCALLVSSAGTLAEMAELLAGATVLDDGRRIQRALNLDGGSSTGLWVKADPEPFYLPEGKEVRNYLGIVAR